MRKESKNRVRKEKKILRIDGNGGIDRISDLPDPILCKILSHLSTKNALATNILSKRWKHLFPFPYGVSPIHLTFNDTESLLKDQSNLQIVFTFLKDPNLPLLVRFRDFVDKLLLYHTSLVDVDVDVDVPRVESMNLSCHKCHGSDKILSWVSTALKLRVQSLVLEFALDGFGALFDTLNGCSTLVSLSMNLDLSRERTNLFMSTNRGRKKTTYFVPDNFSLPNLKKLRLSSIVFDDDDGDDDESIRKCLDGCPVLEDLSFVDCEFHVYEVILIRSESLKCLTIDSSRHAGFCLDLDAPNLQVLIFRCSATRKHRIADFKSLRTAHIDTKTSTMSMEDTYDEDSDDDVDYNEEADQYVIEGIVQLFSACFSTTRLHLARGSIYALSDPSVRLPEFHNLTWLRLGSLGAHGWALLAQLLNNSPNLKELSFEEEFKVNKISEDNKGYADFEQLVLHPPMCLELHVKRIEFCVFSWRDEDSKLLAYFLKNGKMLEKVILRCLPSVLNLLSRSSDPRIILEPR